MIPAIPIISLLLGCGACVADDGAAADPFMAIGEVLEQPYMMSGLEGGTVPYVWRPALAGDYRAYLEAIGVPPEYRSVFEEFIWENELRDRQLVEDESKILGAPDVVALVRTITPGMSEEEKKSIFAEIAAIQKARNTRRNQTAMRQETRRFLQLRAEAERDTLRAIDARCDELAVAADPARRDKARRLFEDGRWRARCCDFSFMVDAARIDLGLLALGFFGKVDDPELQRQARRIIAQYWDEITAPSRRFVELMEDGAIALAVLHEKAEEAGDPDSKARAGDETRRRFANIGSPLFERVDANMRWLPRIADALPENQRGDFIWSARELMFPHVPCEQGVGFNALAAAGEMPGPGAAERSAIASLREERTREIEELNRAMEELTIKHEKSLFTRSGTPESAEREQLEFRQLLARRAQLENRIIQSLRGLLTAEQAAALPNDYSSPVPADPFRARLPARRQLVSEALRYSGHSIPRAATVDSTP